MCGNDKILWVNEERNMGERENTRRENIKAITAVIRNKGR
jgi:hypothetical protein